MYKRLETGAVLKIIEKSKKASVARAERGGIGISSENSKGPDSVGYCRTQ